MTEAAEPVASPYQSLYRRYRPQRFSEVRGQDHVALALRNAVRDQRIAHAYLFSGPRGTGKTSTARILGKALNCIAADAGEPCGVCDSCVAIAEGSSFDVHELDAASNNGVDAMRDLVQRAGLATPGSWKVYIVDEVHMLSTAASNALLKTLEEPPDHVVFVLATTDPQKVLPTIKSRTQHYEFHLLADDVLAGLAEDVSVRAGLDLPDGARRQAVRRAKGSARDVLSALDQLAAAGIVDDDSAALVGIVRAIGQDDGGAAVVALDTALRAGRDPQQLAVEIVEYLRAGFLALVGARKTLGELVLLADDELDAVRFLGVPRCVRSMELLGTAMVAMRDAPDARITLEVALFRAATLDAETSTDALLERLERLEQRVGALSMAGAAPQELPPANVRRAPSPIPPTPGARPALGAYRRTEQTTDPEEQPQASGGEAPLLQNSALAPPVSPDRALPDRARPDSAPEVSAPEVSAPEVSALPDSAPAAPPFAAPPSTASAPSRDELVSAWGDVILTGLRPKARALYQAGRFVEGESGGARFALPNEAHVRMAAPHREEVETSLSDHFGHPVRLELVVDKAPGSPPSAPPGDDDVEVPPTASPGGLSGSAVAAVPEAEPYDDTADLGTPIAPGEVAPPVGIEWAEDRLRQAFPGAEELQA